MTEELFVTELLQKYQILNYRGLFEKKQYSKANLPKELDYIIKPFVLTDEQRKCKAGLLEIAQSTIQLRIQPFLDGNSSTFQIQSSTDSRPLELDHLSHGSNRKQSTTNDKKRKVSSGNVDEEGKKKPKAERKRKVAIKEESLKILLPQILQPLLQEVFDEFWNLELPPEVAIPFFTTITRDNCGHLGMPDFYDKISTECTLADMKEKLSQGLYTIPEQFESDFNLMITNITTYFPSSTPQHQKARELKDQFDQKWKIVFHTISGSGG